MLTRSIRILLFALVTASLLVPPAWVLCLEPTGEVRVELADGPCCENLRAAATEPAVYKASTGCEGCSDVSVSFPGLRTRVDHAQGVGVSVPCAVSLSQLEHASAAVASRRHARPDPAPILAHLASTVITC